MHTKSVPYHDLLYSFQDFEAQALQVIETILLYFPGARTLLDVACGSHQHVLTLKRRFAVDGIDINGEFLDVAQRKNPEGRYVQADMRRFDLGRRYDAVVCLSSSIGYVRDFGELVSTLGCFVRHLNPEGVIVVEPWFTPETWRPGKISIVVGESREVKVARASRRTNLGRDSVMHFGYLVVTPEGMETFSEEHRLTLFTRDEVLSAFAQLGLSAKHFSSYSVGRGLYVASTTSGK